MTGIQFERLICEKLKACGYWAHRIAPNEYGAQPFDIIAARGNKVCIYDCKVLSGSSKRFYLDRVEDNQDISMLQFIHKVSCYECGFLIYHASTKSIYLIPHVVTHNCDRASIKLEDNYLWECGK
jgi:Holliday junction resolvase